ncbi:WD repeat-containing protein on Y chromosome-like [Mizuhopecten yessoensis]|uniref:WD repeat-containing protein on Y chromosome n=1 Tax=Mizuhopecten yessoensis TaxID=6573 RepID=A0A210PMU6_MIZYE|nr:WD repeat-containing protein on Y chromosome-like [Mizuhopecten yessoensis]OWF37797.1 WD repeat-containing protein on Y chromosome [Mizuhopecten yessoensis]
MESVLPPELNPKRRRESRFYARQSIVPHTNSKSGLKLPRIQSAKGSSSRRLTADDSAYSLLEKSKKNSKHSREDFNPDKIAAEIKYARLQEIFEKADTDQEPGLEPHEFRAAIKKTVGGHLTDNEIETLFMKVDANCDGVVDWEEYVTYNLMEYQEKNQMIEMMREKPFPTETRDVPSRHRDIIVRVALLPSIQKRTVPLAKLDYSNGRYVTLSKEGTLIFWTLKMKRIRSFNTHSSLDRATQPWLTDMACMYNVNMLAVTSTDRDIIIFDLQANKFIKRYHIVGIENCITTMYFWANLRDMNYAVLLWGDTDGNTFAIKFDSSLRGGPFGAVGSKDAYKKVNLPEVVRGFFIGAKAYKFSRVHDDWVSQIGYIPELDCVVSCCQSTNNSLYLADIEKKKISTVFKVSKGILSFDYCQYNNIIVTGGMDYLVRVWNPYVNSKAIVVLKGHSKPITHIIINSSKNQIISIDKGKSIRVFDMKDQTCIQQLSGRVIKLGPFPISTVCFNPGTQTLVLGTNQLAFLEKHFEEENTIEVTSHNKPIFAALYNKTFRFVVSACYDSVVSVWDVRNGEKVMQFINAHTHTEGGVDIPVEISAITFDGPERRLITGARDGSVKVWNFNNGACLQTFNTPGGLDVTGLVSTRHRIYVTGWSRTVHIYLDGGGEEYRKEWKAKHNEDIICMSYMGPNIIATGSYDGDIVIWSRDTGQAYCTLNAFKGTKPSTENNTKFKSMKDEEDERRYSLIEEDVMALDDAAGKMKSSKRSSLKGIRVGVGLLSKVRETNSRNGSRLSKQFCRMETPCEHPLMPLFDEQVYTPTPTSEQPSSRHGYDEICKNYEASVEKMIFLENRDNLDKQTAVLFTSGAEGWVRAWSMHHEGGLLGQFNASHKVGEGVHAIASDSENKYLFTADTAGYLKTWDITEYCIREKHTSSKRATRWKELFEIFMFMLVDGHDSREPPLSFNTKDPRPDGILNRPPPLNSNPRRTIQWPLLVNSFKVHTKVVNSIVFIDEFKFVCTCSADCSIRLWTLGGQYIGTFGERWDPIKPPYKPKKFDEDARIPRDLKRIGSARTLKVLNQSKAPKWKNLLAKMKKVGIPRVETQVEQEAVQEEVQFQDDLMEKKLNSSAILGQSYKRKIRHKLPPSLPKMIETSVSMAVFHSMPFVELAPVDQYSLSDDMKIRKYGANLRDKFRGVKRKDTVVPAIAMAVKKIANRGTKVPSARYHVKPSRVKKLYQQMQGKSFDPDAKFSIDSPVMSDTKLEQSKYSLVSDASY